MKNNTIILIKKFISSSICNILKDYLVQEKNEDRLVLWLPNLYMGGIRINDLDNDMFLPLYENHKPLQKLHNVPDVFFSVAKNILAQTSLENPKIAKNSVTLASVCELNGFVNPHIDRNPHIKTHRLMRCNLMVQNSEAGGEFVVQDGNENKIFDLNQGDVIYFFADHLKHWTNPVLGNTSRIIISYPLLVDNDWLKKQLLYF